MGQNVVFCPLQNKERKVMEIRWKKTSNDNHIECGNFQSVSNGFISRPIEKLSGY